MYNLVNSNPTLTNCIIWNNKDQSGTGTANASIFNFSSSFTAIFSLIQGHTTSGDGNNNLDGNTNPEFIQETDFNNPSIVADLHLQSTSPAQNVGTTSPYTGNGPAVGIFTDLDGNQRIRDCAIDLGAYEVQEGTPGPILYVNAAATAGGDGSSWEDAYQNLQAALTAAPTCAGILEIWVAAGTYYPSKKEDTNGVNGEEDREETFVMHNNLAIRGGFLGNEAATYDLTQRDFVTNPTILSGDIGTSGDNSDNCFHVITNKDNRLDATAILDGFTIQDGLADGTGTSEGLVRNEYGAGMYNEGSDPTILNCIFSSNSSAYGGGVYNDNSAPIWSNCSFLLNNATIDGGGMYNFANSNPMLSNCTFEENTATRNGGGMFNDTSSPTLTNCTLQGNNANFDGGDVQLFQFPYADQLYLAGE